MTVADDRQFLAADAYPVWRRRVKVAESSVRIYSPYLDRLVVDLLGNTTLDASQLSVVTDLSPTSGALNYRGQLLAIRRLLTQDIEVRTVSRLHAKVVLIDGVTVTVGSQNFTSYARKSRETTVAAAADLSESRFVATLDHWYDEARPVDLELIERLLEELTVPFYNAKAAIETLVNAYEQTEAAYREEQRQRAIRRFQKDLIRARSSSTASGIRRAAAASPYSAGQTEAFARLQSNETGAHTTLLRHHRDVDLTTWRLSSERIALDTVRLARLAFYPVLLGPMGRMAFVRVAESRITYVWRGVRWSAPRSIGAHRVHMRASFLDDQDDDANLVFIFGWSEGAPRGYEMRLRFDGQSVLPVAEGRLNGEPDGGKLLTEIVESAYENEAIWNGVLRDMFSPAYNPREFRNNPNADTFFPTGWLRINLTRFLDQPVLLTQPYK